MVKFIVLLMFASLSYGHHRQFPDRKQWPKHYSYEKKHHPQSTGKIYQGRQIAEVMGAAGIPWLERETRQSEEDIKSLVDALGLKPGMVVADVGAGSGVLSIKMAQKLGKGGKVVALDIQEKMLKALARKTKKQNIKNIILKQNSIKSMKLPANSIDLALMVDVYHEFSHPHEMLKSLFTCLKPGGRIALVEYRGEDPKVPIKKLHKMTLKQIYKEFNHPDFPYKLLDVYKKLPRQHLVFFKKPFKIP